MNPAILFALLVAGSAQALSTNECFMILATPENICSLNAQGCLCNEAFMMIMGANIPSLAGMCGWEAPYTCLPPSFTYNEGACNVSDSAIDANRFGSILKYFAYIAPLYAESYEQSCFTKAYCVGNMTLSMKRNATVNFPYGLGKYTGVKYICDYLGIPTAGINRGLVQLTTQPSPNDYAVFFPTSIVMGATANTAVALGQTFTPLYYEYTFGFTGCGKRMSSLTLNTHSVLTGVETDAWRSTGVFYQVQKAGVNQYSIHDICSIHETYCNGPNKQYPNYQACVDYMAALPLKTPECGTAKMLFGHALPCKYKHATMVPINKLHCAHIGPLGALDHDGNQKCYPGECASVVDPLPFPWERLDSLDASAYAAAKNAEPYLDPKVCPA